MDQIVPRARLEAELIDLGLVPSMASIGKVGKRNREIQCQLYSTHGHLVAYFRRFAVRPQRNAPAGATPKYCINAFLNKDSKKLLAEKLLTTQQIAAAAAWLANLERTYPGEPFDHPSR